MNCDAEIIDMFLYGCMDSKSFLSPVTKNFAPAEIATSKN